MTFLIATISILILLDGFLQAEDSFSFSKFRGPVSGEVEEIRVTNYIGPNFTEEKVDYTAKPDYFFHYGVQDAATGNSQGHKEKRNGDSVEGEYRVLQEDGLVRIIRYTADPETGFMAYVQYVKLNDQVESQKIQDRNEQRLNSE